MTPNLRTGARLYGPLMMALAMLLFAINDSLIKWLTSVNQVPLFQVLLLRSAWISLLMLVVAIWRMGGLGALWREVQKPAYSVLGWSEVLVAVPYIYALKLLPLQTAQPIIKLSPLVAVLVAVVVLGQRSSPVRWLSIAMGLVGVLVIVNPGENFQLGALVFLPLVGAIVLGVRDVYTNRLGTKLDPFVVALSMGVAMLVMASVAQLFALDGPWRPVDWQTEWLWLLLGLCLTTPLAYVTRLTAIQNGEMTAIAPMTYSGMVWAIVFGVLVFRDPLAWNQAIGAGLIALGGILLIWLDPMRKAGIAAPNP